MRRGRKKVGIVSGYFNPLHEGHLEYFSAARKMVDFLAVIVNSDAQVALKGSKVLQNENTRLQIISSLRKVDYAIVAKDKGKDISKSIKQVHKDLSVPRKICSVGIDFYFFNSGDRAGDVDPKEQKICDDLGIQMVGLFLPKINSSSEIKKNL